MMPVVSDEIRRFREEALHVETEARQAGRSGDARADWAEMRAKAQGRLEGAQGVLARLQDVARGGVS